MNSNYVVLVWDRRSGPNLIAFEEAIKTFSDQEFSLDEASHTWTYNDTGPEKHQLSERRSVDIESSTDIVAVYDVRDINRLNAMIEDAKHVQGKLRHSIAG